MKKERELSHRETKRLDALFGACKDLLCRPLQDDDCVIRTCVPALVAETEAYVAESKMFPISRGYVRGKKSGRFDDTSAPSPQKRLSPLQTLMTLRNSDFTNNFNEESNPRSSTSGVEGKSITGESRDEFIHPVVLWMLNELERIEKNIIAKTEAREEMLDDTTSLVKQSYANSSPQKSSDEIQSWSNMMRPLALWKQKPKSEYDERGDTVTDRVTAGSDVLTEPVKRRVTAAVGSLKCIENLCGNKRGAMRQLCKIQLCETK